MTTQTLAAPAVETLVNMGHIATGKGPVRLKAILGSCIGLAVYHPRLRTGAMAHIVLAEAAGRSGMPGKFADTAVPHLLAALQEQGVPRAALVAKFAGGASMFSTKGPLQVGDANAEAVTKALATQGIRVIAKHVGGAKGRRVIFCCESGKLTVQIAGEAERVL